jgi:hypothetical protein
VQEASVNRQSTVFIGFDGVIPKLAQGLLYLWQVSATAGASTNRLSNEDHHMKTITTTLTATLFSLAAAGVSAADVYQGLSGGHPDLSSQPAGIEDGFGVSPTPPGVGSQIDRYHGIADGNAELFNVRIQGPSDSGERPNIYGAAEGNPDLSF